MNCKAKLVTESKDSSAVCVSIQADNSSDAIMVNTYSQDNMVVSVVEARSVSTVLATIDDILHCQIMAEGLI